MPSTTSERLYRLVGDGNSGGGLPLPPIFYSVCHQLLDNGPQRVETLIPAVEEAVPKPERVQLLYPGTGYRGLVVDVLEQLASRHLAIKTDGEWSLTESFPIGKSVTVIPKQKNSSGIHATIYPKEERERLSIEATEKREFQAMCNDIRNERTFEVLVMGGRGAPTAKFLRLHPLAKAIPQMTEGEFIELARDVKEHGVKLPIILFEGKILDGRHRAAIASILRSPVRVEEFPGDENAARDHVISLNVMRRHLTIAQRGLITIELFLPQAEAEAKAALTAAQSRGRQTQHDGLPPIGGSPSRKPTAVEIAAARSNGLAQARTLERMLPVREAPETQERIKSGDIKTALKARKAAIEELGLKDVPRDVPGQDQKSVYQFLGRGLVEIRKANRALDEKNIGIASAPQCVERIEEIRVELNQIERRLNSGD